LLATSGSAAGRNATAVAAELAKSLAAELTIIHVVPAIEYRVGRLTPTLTATGRLHEPDANPILRDAVRIASSMGIPAHTMLIAGSPPRVIVALASRLNADLIVIGATHRRGPAQLLARTGRRVQAHAPCPVLAVPDHAAREPTGRPDRDPTGEHTRKALMLLVRRLLRLLQRDSRACGYRPSTDRSTSS
jgi:nucleotide-binding universal stress UspA family protein